MSELFIKQVHLPETGDTVELFLFDSSGSSLYTETLKDTVYKMIFYSAT
jgi:hypothetical protein